MIRKVLITTGACVWLALLSPASMAADKVAAKPTNSSDTYRLLSLFGDVFERVRNEYVEPVTDEQLIEAALNGMVTSLDPHSSYMNEKSYKDMQVQTKAEFGGLGLEVTMDHEFVKVISPMEDTPAWKADLRPNDYIVQLDGESVQGMSLNDAVDHMRGPVNTPIRLTIRREGVAPFDVTLTRAKIKVPTVKSKLIHNIGYLRVSSFAEPTDTELHKAIEQIRKDAGKDLQGVVLDLRNNPGGLLDQAVAVSSEFIDKGEIVSTRSRHPEDTQVLNAPHGNKDSLDGLPMVVLINDGSASASEIVAGALQDHRRAVLMGTRSFGKGSVQTIIPLPGHGALRLTTARYYTPSGRSIQAVGIEPDIKVQQSKVETLASGSERPRSESSLRGALRNDTLPKETAPAKDDSGKAAPSPGASAAPIGSGPPGNVGGGAPGGATPTAGSAGTPPTGKEEAPAEAAAQAPEKPGVMGDPDSDYQLARAIDLLHGLSIYHPAAKPN